MPRFVIAFRAAIFMFVASIMAIVAFCIECNLVLVSTIKFFKDNKLHSCYNFALALHEKWTCFQQVRRALFFQVYYYTQVESEISDQVTDE